MAIQHEAILSRLGSRLSLDFLPSEKRIRVSALGRFYDTKEQMCFGIQIGNEKRILPLSEKYNSFERVDMELTPTSVQFLCFDSHLGIKAVFKFTSPLCPDNLELSGFPFFLLFVQIEYCGFLKIEGDAILTGQGEVSINGQVFFELEESPNLSGVQNQPEGISALQKYALDEEIAVRKWLHKTRSKEHSSAVYKGELGIFTIEKKIKHIPAGFEVPFTVKKFEKTYQNHCICGYCDEKILLIGEALYKFDYTVKCKTLSDVYNYCKQNYIKAENYSKEFDAAIQTAATTKSFYSLLSISLQNYLCNTWLAVDEEEKQWFSVWEGNCAYHNTIDVEYNCALFSILFFPKLLAMQIAEWVPFLNEKKFMPHDIGKFLVVQGMEYAHHMEVEESANYIILVYALNRIHPDLCNIWQYQNILEELANYIINSDTTGNGFPDEGTANTFDDAGSAIQYAKEQTYLAIKSYCALIAASIFAKETNNTSLEERCKKQLQLIEKNLDKAAWLGDHYAVCISKNSTGMKDVWTGQLLDGEIQGWDASSLIIPNALAFMLLTDTPLGLNLENIKKDIDCSMKQTMTNYACTHSSTDHTGVFWISQNIWRDYIACMLGKNYMDNTSNYWDYELCVNQKSGGYGGFVDTSTTRGLFCYPRGVCSFGLLIAQAGMKINTVLKTLSFYPVKVPCKVVLYPFVNWEESLFPCISFFEKKGDIVWEITHKELLKDYKISVFNKQI